MNQIKSFFREHPIVAWNGTGIVLAFLTHWVIWLVFFSASIIFYLKLSARRRAEKRAALIQEAESYIATVKEQKGLPQIPTNSLFLSQGEYAFLEEKSDLKETRAVRKSRGGFGGVRVAKGITIGGYSGTSESHQEWRLLDSGELILTNEKLIFRGNKTNRTIPIDKIMGIDAFPGGIEIDIDGKTKSAAFTVKNPFIWNAAISILRSGKNPLNLEGVELNVEFR
jgi:hypothetical protein